jgi:rhodanese-related sulfurtransferase
VTTPARLDAAALRALLESGDTPTMIDVRTPGEFEAAHIPGSYNVPLDLLREHRPELRDRLTGPVLFICRSGQRAAQAKEALDTAGLPASSILHGGITAWQAAGGTVAAGRPHWELERQVRLVAGSIVLGSVLASAAVPKAKWIAAAIGGGLTFAALSDTCAMGMALARLPYNRSAGADINAVLDALSGDRS